MYRCVKENTLTLDSVHNDSNKILNNKAIASAVLRTFFSYLVGSRRFNPTIPVFMYLFFHTFLYGFEIKLFSIQRTMLYFPKSF